MTTTLQSSPFLSIRFHKSGNTLVDNQWCKRSLRYCGELVNLLTFCRSAKISCEVEAFAREQGIDASALEMIKECRFIIPSDAKEFIIARSGDRWRKLGWGAALELHLSTYNYPFVDYSSPKAFEIDRQRMVEYKREAMPPSRFSDSTSDEEFSMDAKTPFPATDYASLVSGAYLRDSASSIQERFRLFMTASFGASDEKTIGGITTLRKTVPSGGARHPIEAYTFLYDDLIFPSGVYHYNVKRRCLVRIGADAALQLMEASTYHEIPKKCRRFSIAYTSVVTRAMWRYRDPRSSRAIFADLGHSVEGANTNAVALGFIPISEYPFRESRASAPISCKFLEEPVLHVTHFNTI